MLLLPDLAGRGPNPAVPRDLQGSSNVMKKLFGSTR